MWNRAMIKSNAKVALTGTYWTAFAVSLIAMIIMGAFSYLTAPLRVAAILNGEVYSQNPFVSLCSILFSVFVAIPITIGMCRYFMQNHFGAGKLETLFSGFQWGYMNSVGASFVTYVFVVLWSFLLIVPGIIKALQYSMVPFILSDNPDMPGSRAREISKQLTNGEKGSIFVFLLSFLGWFFLGALCFGIGTLFVYPYFYASFAELYIFLRDRAIANGALNPAELNLVPPEQPAPMM